MPEGLTLHYADLAEGDIAARNGYRLTTPLRTILGFGGGRYDAARGVVEGAAGDFEAAADHTQAGERREDTRGGAAATGGAAGVEEAVSDPTQAKGRLEWGTRLQQDLRS